MTRAIASVLMFLAGAGSMAGADFHVAPTGNDTNPGTREKPLKTFEAGTFGNWTVKGAAFDQGPVAAAIEPDSDTTGSVEKGLSQSWNGYRELYRQPELGRCDAAYFANSFHPRALNRAVGTLTSPPFKIEQPYLTCQLAGGGAAAPGKLAVNLLIDGAIVRQARPREKSFTRVTFDTRELKGRMARIRVVDEQHLHGGWIAAGAFAAADTPADGPVVGAADAVFKHTTARREMRCTQRYLNIPARRGFPDDEVKVWVGGRVVQEICMAVADAEEAQFWQFIDLDPWRDAEILVTMDGWTASDAPLAGAVMDAVIRGIDNDFDERLRPQFHFTPPQGWNNDVNGTVYYDGEYHLFYQYDPSRSGFIGRNMHWGHAVSSDFFHWRHLPIALGVDRERGQNYSGSAIVDLHNDAGLQQGAEKTMIAFYTRRKPYTYTRFDFDVDGSEQCMAYSTDRGRSWTHVDEAILPGITAKNRDPKVFFHDASGKWIMALAVRNGYDFFSSENLKHWTRESRSEMGFDCPDVFQLAVDPPSSGDKPERVKWVLVSGEGDHVIGEFDGKRFVEESRGRAVFGKFHATQTFANAPDGTLRRVQMSWFDYSPGNVPFSRMISLPLELTLRTTDAGVRLFAEPARELENLRIAREVLPNADLGESALTIEKPDWDLAELVFTVAIGDATGLDMMVRGQPFGYDVRDGKLAVPKSKAVAPITLVDGKLKLRLLLDRCSLDICAQDGVASLMHGFHPDPARPLFECTAEGGRALVKDIAIYRLKSIWTDE